LTFCLLIDVNHFVSYVFYSFTYAKYASFHKILASSCLSPINCANWYAFGIL